jgi:hypothetical protein
MSANIATPVSPAGAGSSPSPLFVGEEMVMTGRQAKAQNEVLMEIYREDIRAEIDAGVKFGQTVSVLKRWVIVERHVSENVKDQARRAKD